MPSLRSRLFLNLMRLRRFRTGGKAIFDWDTSIDEFRQYVDKSSRLFGKVPKDITVTPVQIDDLYAEWILPEAVPKDRAILYFHGGGYVCGTCQNHRTHVAKIVKGSGIGALLFEYRLAPEHPYPAALDDAVAAYRWLLAQGISPTNIVFMGDSAGGGLCLATLLACRDQGLDLPAGAVALSPWTDLKCSGDSYVTRRQADLLAPGDSWTIFSKYYVGDNDAELPWISPLYGELDGLPPLSIYVGENEVLFDDSARFAEKAQTAGVEVRFTVGEKLFHCYPICAPIFPEATRAMAEIHQFIRERIAA